MTFTARFSGTPCDVCEEPVKEGQEVDYNAANNLIHVVCPELLEAYRMEQVCSSCNLILPATGVCDDCG